MAGQIQTTTPGMRSAAQTIESTESAIRQQRSNVESELGDLTSRWKGDAASAYWQACQPWINDVETITNSLREMHQLLLTQSHQIDAAEGDQTQTATGLTSQAGLNLH